MSSSGLEDAIPQGTTWPDVGLAIVTFAREDTVRFIAAVIATGLAVCLAFLGLRQMFRNDYLRRRAWERDRAAQDHPLGGENND